MTKLTEPPRSTGPIDEALQSLVVSNVNQTRALEELEQRLVRILHVSPPEKPGASAAEDSNLLSIQINNEARRSQENVNRVRSLLDRLQL